jgi:hypothetical protein
MALYEYELYLLREADRGDIAQDLLAAGLLELAEGTALRLPFGVHAEWSESTNRVRTSMPLRILTLALETSEFEDILTREPASFINWLWAVCERASIAYAFMSPGSYAAYYQAGGITAEKVFSQVGELVEKGDIRFVHPLMFFAERAGGGRACAVAREAPIYHVDYKASVGCLLMLIDGDPARGPLEILDPGTAYPRVAKYFGQSSAHAARQ